MIKKLTKHGNSWALVIDMPILDLLKIDPEQPLELSTDGTTLTVAPVKNPRRRAALEAALEKTNRRYGRVLKTLAE